MVALLCLLCKVQQIIFFVNIFSHENHCLQWQSDHVCILSLIKFKAHRASRVTSLYSSSGSSPSFPRTHTAEARRWWVSQQMRNERAPACGIINKTLPANGGACGYRIDSLGFKRAQSLSGPSWARPFFSSPAASDFRFQCLEKKRGRTKRASRDKWSAADKQINTRGDIVLRQPLSIMRRPVRLMLFFFRPGAHFNQLQRLRG